MATKRKKTIKKTSKSKKLVPQIDVNVNVTVNEKTNKRVGTKTKIALVVDRSGSMTEVREAAFQGINEQIETIRRNADKNGDTEVLYIQFSDIVERVFRKQARDLRLIERRDYNPEGSTALRDAVWTAISDLDNGSSDKDTAYLVIVISDGWENASRTTARALADRIRQLQNSGQWTFTYMMSNIDLSQFRNTVYAHVNNSIVWDSSTDVGTRRAFNTIATSTSNYLRERKLTGGPYSTRCFYNPSNSSLTDSSPNVTFTDTKVSNTGDKKDGSK